MRRLSDPEYSRIWDAFTRHFDFRPSCSGPHPGIVEPDPSVTFELLADYTDDDVDEFSTTMRRALRHCATKSGEVYYLDWQHDCFAFVPSQDEPRWFNGYPDGDYAIFLASDLSFGSFGHAWEGTICFFGQELIDQVLRAAPRMLTKRVRSTGVSA